MVRISTGVTDNGAGLAFQGSELTFMVGIIAASISTMAVVIFACAKSSVKSKGQNPYSGSGKTSNKTVVGESKGQKTPQTSATIRAIGVDTISNSTNNSLAAATFVDIAAMEDNDDGKDNNQFHGSDTTNTGADKNIISGGSGGHTNSSGDNDYMSGGHTHVSNEITTCGGGAWS